MAAPFTPFLRLTLLVASVAMLWLGSDSAQAQQPGLVMGAVPDRGGIGLVAFEGSVDALRATAQSEGCQLESVWATVGGRFVGYTFGRPAFVNAAFANEVGIALRSDQVLLLVCGSGSAPPTSPPTAAPPPGATPPPSTTPPPSGAPAPPFSTTPLYDPAGPDLACSDFPTQADAQILFEAAGGPEQDRHGLDPDGNGLACEELP